ncbi:hypothetical protein [uncultured Cohaesibacter sp.]|uniref:hypothetical protein n=1 Tax=uncultured Cohaesibacter sp. TaxID=1002546 RepID=UPI0029C68C07|nr:hypothetical protein [uncultured Cohaesibacter sp.]
MTRLLNRYRLIGLMLMIMGVMGLVYSGIDFSASFNSSKANQLLTAEIKQTQLSAKFSHTPCQQRATLLDEHQSHCSAKILALSSLSQSFVSSVGSDSPTQIISNLEARNFTPDPPPPRAV